MDRHIVWGNKDSGSSNSAVTLGGYLGFKTSIKPLSYDFSGVKSVAIEEHTVYFIA